MGTNDNMEHVNIAVKPCFCFHDYITDYEKITTKKTVLYTSQKKEEIYH